MKSLLGGAALCFGLAAPAMAQTPDSYPHISAGRQMGGPAGDALAKPADPSVQPTSPSSNPDLGKRETPATNALSPPIAPGQTQSGSVQGNSAQANGQQNQATTPAPLNVTPGQNILGTRGGAALAANQEYDQQLARYEVRGKSGNDIGNVQKVLLDLGKGRIEAIELDIDGKSVPVSWTHVVDLDTKDRRLVLDIGREELKAEAAPRSFPPGVVYADDFAGSRVYGINGKELGDVAGLVVDLSTNRIDTLMLSGGSFLGIGDKIFDVPWQWVSAVNPQEQTVQLKVDQDALRPNPEYGELERQQPNKQRQ